MKVTTIVKAFDVMKERETGLLGGGGLAFSKALDFESSKEALHERIVVAIGFSTHAGSGADGLE